MSKSLYIRTKDNIYKVYMEICFEGKLVSYLCIDGVYVDVENVIMEAKTIEELIMVEDLVAVGLDLMRLEKPRGKGCFKAWNMRLINVEEVDELYINISDDKELCPTWKLVAWKTRFNGKERLELTRLRWEKK